MADFMVPPHGSCMIKCKGCKGLYMPESTNTWAGDTYFEKCPFCGCTSNTYKNTIPIWKYNLIKFFRSGKQCEDIEKSLTKFEFEKNKEEKKEPTKQKKVMKTVTSTQYVNTPKPPAKDDYYYHLYVQQYGKTKSAYKFYGFVDSIADLPNPKQMEKNSLFYVDAREKFAVPNGKYWNLESEVEEQLVGEQRSSFLNEARKCIPKKEPVPSENGWGNPKIVQW